MSEHVPGPWAVEGEVEQSTCCCASEYRVRIVGGVAAEEIAQVLGEDWERKDKKRCSEAAHANARLIAAAPDLLNAAKLALVDLIKTVEFLEGVNKTDGAYPTLVALRAAIAKAEGK